MTRLKKFKRISAFAAAVIMLVMALYVPGVISAETSDTDQVTYNYYSQNENYITADFSDDTLADFGISSYGGGFNRDNADGLFDTEKKYQRGMRQNAETNAVYETEPNTAFHAEFVPITPSSLKSYANSKDFVIKLQGWNELEKVWVDITSVTVTKSSYSASKKLYTADITPEENLYSQIRILWPAMASTKLLGDSCLGLSSVTFTHKIPDTRLSYDYTDLEALPMDSSIGLGGTLDPAVSPAKLGIYKISKNTDNSAICGLNRYEKLSGALVANYGMINNSEVGEAEFYADYHVAGGSLFTVTLYISDSTGWGKPYWEAMECYQGRKFEFKLLTSPDGTTWTEAYATGDQSGKMLVEITVPEDAKYVRVLYPQDGNPNGAGNHGEYTKEDGTKDHYRIFNDMASLDGVKFEPGENYAYGKYFDFDAIGANELRYMDTVYQTMLFHEYEGVVISEYENGKAYLGASEDYALTATADSKPFVTYCVTGESETKVVITKDSEKAAAMGEDWNVKIYESTDNVNWNLVTATPETAENAGLGVTETYKFITAADTKYLKIELPHSGVVGEESGAKIIGVASVGITPGEYGEIDPYGTHTFGLELNYTDSTVFSVKETIDLFNKLAYYVYQSGNTSIHFDPGKGFAASWSYLNGKESVSPTPYIVYNVVSGTAFQTEITFGKSTIDTIEKALGKEFLPKLYISSDYKEWTEYTTSSVRMSASQLRKDRAALILTIDSIPEGINYVKISLPQNGDVSKLTNGAFAYAGNDILEIASVSFTKGDETPPEEYDDDRFREEEEDDGDDDYIFLPPSIDVENVTYIPGADTGTTDSTDNSLNYTDTVIENDTEGEAEVENVVTTPEKRKGKKVVKKVITVIDGYYYPLWVWICWIAGGVAFLAAVTVLVIVLVKKKKKKTA